MDWYIILNKKIILFKSSESEIPFSNYRIIRYGTLELYLPLIDLYNNELQTIISTWQSKYYNNKFYKSNFVKFKQKSNRKKFNNVINQLNFFPFT